MEKRVAIIKEFADKVISFRFGAGHPIEGTTQIAVSAQKDLQPYDTQVEVLKENLQAHANSFLPAMYLLRGEQERAPG